MPSAWREPIPPLIRSLLEAVLDEAGVEAEVRADGSIYDLDYEQPLGGAEGDAAILTDAAVKMDLALEALTGCRGTLGQEVVLQLLKPLGRKQAESLYRARCEFIAANHPASPDVVKDALKRCKRIVNKDKHARNSGRRRHDR